MKDLYTFDSNRKEAMQTYEDVRAAYTNIFNELGIPYLVAKADSGNMGGTLSHEYHLPSAKGEDTILSCSNCGVATNEELVLPTSTAPNPAMAQAKTVDASILNEKSISARVGTWTGISADRKTLVQAYYPLTDDFADPALRPSDIRSKKRKEVNPYALKAILPILDLGIEEPLVTWMTSTKEAKITEIFDHRLPDSWRGTSILRQGTKRAMEKTATRLLQEKKLPSIRANMHQQVSYSEFPDGEIGGYDLLRKQTGDACPNCKGGTLTVQKAIEVGHTFFLGTRYSKPLGATVAVVAEDSRSAGDKSQLANRTSDQRQDPMEMGCHGIGVSRMIAAVADCLADDKGLNWPRCMAPFEVVIIAFPELEQDAERIYDLLDNPQTGSRSSGIEKLDVILDDRKDQRPTKKLNDADLIGYPVIVVLGKVWNEKKLVEVQCRMLGLKEYVEPARLADYVAGCLQKL